VNERNASEDDEDDDAAYYDSQTSEQRLAEIKQAGAAGQIWEGVEAAHTAIDSEHHRDAGPTEG